MQKKLKFHELQVETVEDLNKYHDKSLLQTNFLEPTVAVIPCMGSGDNARLGKKLT